MKGDVSNKTCGACVKFDITKKIVLKANYNSNI